MFSLHYVKRNILYAAVKQIKFMSIYSRFKPNIFKNSIPFFKFFWIDLDRKNYHELLMCYKLMEIYRKWKLYSIKIVVLKK